MSIAAQREKIVPASGRAILGNAAPLEANSVRKRSCFTAGDHEDGEGQGEVGPGAHAHPDGRLQPEVAEAHDVLAERTPRQPSESVLGVADRVD